jgi:ATP adenylyltransferase
VSHEQLWAPWRLSYIVSSKEKPAEQPGCFICRYLAEPQGDVENYVVHRGQQTIALLNRFPYNNGHILVAPAAHKAGLGELNDGELLECMQVVQRLTALLQELVNPDGFNVGLNLGRAAGAGLPGHLHWHIVPRWNGDTSFMPVLADVNVIPQSLAEMHALLTDALRRP